MDYLARLVGSFALLIAAISMFLHWRTYHRDKSDIRLSLDYRHETLQGSAFGARIENHGRRRAIIERVTIHFLSSRPLDQRFYSHNRILLEEAESIGLQFPIASPAGDPIAPVNVTELVVCDSLGKKYRYPGSSFFNKAKFARLKRSIQEQWEERN